MAPTKIGTLVVVVLKARNLPNPGMYKQSPYILARLGGGGKRTKMDAKGGQHPVWDEDLHFEIYPQDMADGGPRVLKLTCYVEGRKKVDESIGEGELAVDDVLKNGEFDGWVPLSLNGTQRGEVYLELTWFVNAQRLGRRPSKLSPAERFYRPSPPQSPGGSPRPSSSHSNGSSPGRVPLSLPPPGIPGASGTASGGRTPPLALPLRQQQQQQQQQSPPQALGVPPQSNAYPNTPPLTPPSYPSNTSQPGRPADHAYAYYDPLAARSGAPPPAVNPAANIPASLRPGRPINGVAYLDPFNPPTLPPRPAESNPPPTAAPALPERQPARPPQAAPAPVQTKQESEALRAQRLVWEERDRRRKQEEEDEAFARQLMLEEEENERVVQGQAQAPADGRSLPGGWMGE